MKKDAGVKDSTFGAVLLFVLISLLNTNIALSQEGAKPTISKLISHVGNALARLEFTIDPKIIRPTRRFGTAICVNASKRIFLTLDIPAMVPRDQLKDFVLTVPGNQKKRIKAKLLSVDIETGVGFLQADEGYKWSELRFPLRSNLRLGQRVLSVGLLGGQFGNTPYFTEAKVSAVVRVPAQMVFVTAGELASFSSPVLSEDGKPIGIVGGDVPLTYRMLLGGKWMDVRLAGRQLTRFFVPVEEFAGLIPTHGRPGRMPWLGVVRYFAPQPGQAIKGLKENTAAVILGQIIPNGPAFKAGLRQGDVIIGMNNKPLEQMATPALVVAQFKRQIVRLQSNERITFTVLRDGKTQVFQLRLEPVPTRPFEAEHYYNNRLGMVVRDMVVWDRYVGRTKPLLEKGVLLENVRRNSPADKAGLRPGDVIIAVNNTPVKAVSWLKGSLDRLTADTSTESINFVLWRGDKPQSVRVNLK
ncbi:MAG: PDZ domain-containing protein [Planctomycetes bacterium]|nr:PDZ domain-containing protein [Planctomycetota bacterium]